MITKAEWDRVKREYRFVPDDDGFSMPAECRAHGDWRKVYCEGCDSKYGSIMVSRSMRAWRRPTFYEFYGGAAVD